MISLSKLIVPNKRLLRSTNSSASPCYLREETRCASQRGIKKLVAALNELKGFNSRRSELLWPLPAQAPSPACPWGWFTVTLAVPRLFLKGR